MHAAGRSGIKIREDVIGREESSVVGGIVQHQVNSEEWEELMWQKQHKAYTLRPQPLKFIADEDIGNQNQREKKKNDGIK